MANIANLPTMLAQADYHLRDPGTGAKIVVARSSIVNIVTGASGETNTLATPTADMLNLVLVMTTDGGGDRVVTVDSGVVSGTGTSVITLNDADDNVQLISIPKASGGFRWALVNYDGVTFA